MKASIRLVCCLFMLGSGMTAAPQLAVQVPAGVQDDLEALRRALLQPGEGARAEREGAIDQLLLRRDALAHGVLARSLHDGDDRDGRGRFLLDNLARRLVLAADPVFGDEKVRAAVLDPYFDAWLRPFAEGEQGLGDRSTPEFRAATLRCFRVLTFRERSQQLERISQGADFERVRAALLLAGRSRDLGLGPWIAERLDHRELAATARQALSDLTFVKESFADRAAFLDWQATHRGIDYVQLAEDAAREAAAAVRSVREETAAIVIERTTRLVAALARAEAPDWKAIQQELLRADPPALTIACAGALRDVLADRVSLTPRPAGNGADRLELTRNVRELLVLREDRQDQYAVLLEVMAYLTVRDDAAQRAATEEKLIAALGPRAQPVVRRAALRGLRRFPSIDNRGAVLRAIEAAVATSDAATVAAGLECLAAATWTAPDQKDADRPRWIETLGRVLTIPRIEATLAEAALQVAIVRDGTGALVADVYPLLLEIAGDVRRDATLRSLVVKRLVAFATDDERSDRWIDLSLRLLGDPDAGLRRLAAAQFASLPESSMKKREQWTADFVRAAAVRVIEETDEAVLRELCAVMVAAADQPAQTESVLTALAVAATRFAADPAQPGAEARQKVLAEQLRVLGVSRSRTRAEWIAVGRALLVLRARDPLRTVLERQDAIKLAADSKEPGVADAMQLYVGAARLDDGRSPWRDRATEADELRRAFDALDRLGVAIGDARDVELRIAALESLGRGSELAAVVERGVALPGLSPETQANWRATQARMLIEQSAYDEAARALRALDATGVGNGKALDLWTSLAQRRLATGDPSGAAAILADVLTRTPAETPAWCPRFLLSIEARLAVDAPPRESLLAELRSAAARFAEGATTPEHATKYRELLGRCGGRP